jgi:hypothetical protein
MVSQDLSAPLQRASASLNQWLRTRYNISDLRRPKTKRRKTTRALLGHRSTQGIPCGSPAHDPLDRRCLVADALGVVPCAMQQTGETRTGIWSSCQRPQRSRKTASNRHCVLRTNLVATIEATTTPATVTKVSASAVQASILTRGSEQLRKTRRTERARWRVCDPYR